MHLTLREKDKLLVSVAAMVAERRLRRGVKLNYPEAVALITDYVLEGARDGKTVAELMRDGKPSRQELVVRTQLSPAASQANSVVETRRFGSSPSRQVSINGPRPEIRT